VEERERQRGRKKEKKKKRNSCEMHIDEKVGVTIHPTHTTLTIHPTHTTHTLHRHSVHMKPNDITIHTYVHDAYTITSIIHAKHMDTKTLSTTGIRHKHNTYQTLRLLCDLEQQAEEGMCEHTVSSGQETNQLTCSLQLLSGVCRWSYEHTRQRNDPEGMREERSEREKARS
jgi:hypothetical protein